MEKEDKRDLLKLQIEQAFNIAASQPVSEPVKNPEIVVIDAEKEGFFKALRNVSLSKVKKYIESGLDIEIKDKYGNSPLLLAGKCKIYKLIKYLIDAGANFQVINNYRESILHYTVCSNKLMEITQYVIENIQSENELDFFQIKNSSHHRTALHLALHHQPSNISLAKLFIKDKCKFLLNVPDKNGFTPAHIAIKQNCSLEMFEFLLENEADFNIPATNNIYPLVSSILNSNFELVRRILEVFPNSIEINPDSAKQPIQHAARKSTPDIINHLLKCGAKVVVENSHPPPIVSLCYNYNIGKDDELSDLFENFINHGAYLNTHFNYNECFLHQFRISSNAKLVDYLIKKGLSLNIKNSNGLNPMANSVRSMNLAAILVLLPHYANMKEDEEGRTLLHHACILSTYVTSKQDKIIKLLIDHQVDVNAIDNNGKTALHHFFNASPCYSNPLNIDSLKLLLENGARVNIQDENGNTPLLLFSEIFARATIPENCFECLKLLLDVPADPNIPDLYSVYPIHFISQWHIKPMELLVKRGAKVDVVAGVCPIVQEYPYRTINYLLKHEMLGFTPLFAPVMNGAFEVVEFLLQRNCDVNRKSLILSRNVLHFACLNFIKNKEENNIAVLKILLRFGVDANARDDRGDTPLIIACRVASESYIKRFRRGGGLCGILSSIVSGFGVPPFSPDSAVRFISALIDGGADRDIRNKANESAISLVTPEFNQLTVLLSKH